MIFGPTGDRRLDEHFAWLRHVVFSCHCERPPTLDECVLKYDWKRYFPKDDKTILAEAVNFERDFAFLESRFLGKKTTAGGSAALRLLGKMETAD